MQAYRKHIFHLRKINMILFRFGMMCEMEKQREMLLYHISIILHCLLLLVSLCLTCCFFLFSSSRLNSFVFFCIFFSCSPFSSSSCRSIVRSLNSAWIYMLYLCIHGFLYVCYICYWLAALALTAKIHYFPSHCRRIHFSWIITKGEEKKTHAK